MSSIKNASLDADLPSFPPPSLITGDSLRPNLVLVFNNTIVYLLELTVGFEYNIKANSDHKATNYHPLLTNLLTEYTNINFVKFSMSAHGIFGMPSDRFLQMLYNLNFNQSLANHIFVKVSGIAIRCTYYIYCRRNKNGKVLIYCSLNTSYVVSMSLFYFVIFAFSYCI